MKQARLKLKPDAATQRHRKLTQDEQVDADNLYAAEYYMRKGFGGAFEAFAQAVFKRLGRPQWKPE